MTKWWIYIILIIFEMALVLAYGFLLQSVIPFGVCLFIAFFVPLFIMFVSLKEQRDLYAKMIEALTFSLFSTAVFIGVFFCGNQLHRDFINEYDVIVEYVNRRGGGYADFVTPQGDEGRVDLHDYRFVIVDHDCVDVGDTIRVREYKGLFNRLFYVFVEEIH